MNATVCYAVTGSFCCLGRAMAAMQALKDAGFELIPLLSENAATVDTRFGAAKDFQTTMETLAGRAALRTLTDVEPIGPKKQCDLLIVSPCTGNTLGKLAAGIYDTAVTLAVKSQLRANRPVLLGVSTNDALSGSAKSIAHLLNARNLFFIPMAMDAPQEKPRSMVCRFELTVEAASAAMEGRQLPLLA